MHISVNSRVELDYDCVGFGNAISNMYKTLLRLGHKVTLEDDSAPVQLHWNHPHNVRLVPGKYNIIYFPIESTELLDGWMEIVTAPGVDELWTTSEWCANVFKNLGISKPIHVYKHGITSHWKPKMRQKDGPLKYLIVDAEANRKGYQEAFDAFIDVFGEDKNKATLTVKSRQRSLIKWSDQNRFSYGAEKKANVSVIQGRQSEEDMIALYHNHDVLIYPSYGEGFGFIPFQMLATGGIAITTEEWAPYKDYLGDFGIRSSYGNSPWWGEHNGEVCYPDAQHLRELIQLSYDTFDDQVKGFYARSWDLHDKYDWSKLTQKAFENLAESLIRLENCSRLW